ncbi:MAG: SDR family oxidoreductase [Anaerolineales bacterium]|nr:SDR family oxidoreductase [Anaerolineales bacterium]
MKVNNKVIVVTGGGNGIGQELVLNLLNKGAKVAALDISEAGLQHTVERAGAMKDRLSTHIVDVTDRAAVEALPAAVIEKHGAVDGIINNAGIIQPFVRINDLDYAAIDRVININLYGVIYMTKAFLPYLLDRPEGHVVNVSSMGGFLPVPGQSVYGASKAAVKLFTEGLYAELLDTNVRVTVVFPGAIGTEITKNSGVEAGNEAEAAEEGSGYKVLPPADAAEIIVGAMEKDAYRVLVGSDARFMDFLYRLAPKRAVKMISDQMKTLLGN